MPVSQQGGSASVAAPQDSSAAQSLEPHEDDDPMVAYMKLAKKRRLAEKAADEAARAAFLASLRAAGGAPEKHAAHPRAHPVVGVHAKKNDGSQLLQPQQPHQQPRHKEDCEEDATVTFAKLSKKWKVKVEPGASEEEVKGVSRVTEAQDASGPREDDKVVAEHAAQEEVKLASVGERREEPKEEPNDEAGCKEGGAIKNEAKAEGKGADRVEEEDAAVITYCHVMRKTRVKLELLAEEAKKAPGESTEARHQSLEGESTAEEANKVADEAKGEAKGELEAEVKSGPEAKEEVEDECKVEVKEEVKVELKSELKSEIKAEVKEEVKKEVKDEVKYEVKEDVKDEAKAEAADETKAEVNEEENYDDVIVKSEPQDSRFWNPSSFSARLPIWNKMCVDFQAERNTWAPARPCCLACFFQEVPAAPPRDGEIKACYYRLTKEQRREFRRFIESGKSDTKWRGTFCTKVWDRLLHPELVKKRRRHKGPIQRRPPGLQLRVDLPWLDYELPGWVWEGHGWMLMPDLSRKRITPTCIAPGSQVFEGRGQVKVPRKGEASLQPASGEDEQAESAGQAGAGPPGGGGAEEQLPVRACTGPQSSVGADVATFAGRGSFARSGKWVVASKQSGVDHILWEASCNSWHVQWSVREGQKSVKHHKRFPLRAFQKAGQSPEAADAAALQAAVAFRQELVRSGQLRPRRAALRQSGVTGVAWEASNRGWRVLWQPRLPGQKKQRKIRGGVFRPKDESPEEVERARLLAVQRRRELEREHGVTAEVRQAVDPSKVAELKSHVPGVNFHNGSWVAEAKQGLAWLPVQRKRFYPNSSAQEEFDRTRREAEEWLLATRKERAKKITALQAASHKKRRVGK